MKNKTIEMPKLNNIQYVKGDATRPQGDGNKVIVHCVNNMGVWGRGFVMAVSAKWPEPEQSFRELFATGKGAYAGAVDLIPVSPNIVVANVYGQEGITSLNGIPPIRYKSLDTAFDFLGAFCKTHNAGNVPTSIHMPRIGCGLAGGDWDKVSELIERNIIHKGVTVTVYDVQQLLH